MKILIYAHEFPPQKAGMPFANFDIAQCIHNLGYTIEVVACKGKGTKEFISGLNFSVHLLPKWPFTKMNSLSKNGLLNWVFTPWYFLVIRHRIKTYKPDIILVIGETANCFWGVWARQIKIPYISYCSVPFLSNVSKIGKLGILSKVVYKLKQLVIVHHLRELMRVSYKNARLVLVVSNSTRKELIRVSPEIASKIHIVPNTIDSKFFNMPADTKTIHILKQQLGISRKHFVLLSVTRLTVDKGVDDVIRALSSINKNLLKNIKYLIVGEGKAENYLKRLVDSLDLNKNVIFIGAVPHLQLIPYYDMCDLFILPSRRGKQESFGLVFAEAAARSKPSIGVNEGGMVDVIEDGITGFLVSAGDIKTIRDKIIYSTSNVEKVRDLGEKARFKAEETYTSHVIALQFEKYLKNTIRIYQ